jgi:hypothetical protein
VNASSHNLDVRFDAKGLVANAGLLLEVLRSTLTALLSGKNPRTGEVVRRAGGDGTRVAALDVTVSMSSRTTEIAELRATFMAETGREPEGRAFDAWIVKQRGPKARLTSEELRRAWIEEAEEHGADPEAVEELLALADLRRAVGIVTRDEYSPQADELRDLVLEHVCQEHAFVPESYPFRLAHQLAVGLIGAEYVDRVLIRMLIDGDLLVTKGDRKITTLEVLAWEQRARRGARRLLEAPPLPAGAAGAAGARRHQDAGGRR